MRTIIAGSRSVNSQRLMGTVMQSAAAQGIVPTVVLSGTARGADRLGEAWARMNDIPIERYPAAWETLGARAGYLRNSVMASKAEALVAIWDGKSKGTKHMIEIARARGLLTFVYITE